MRFCLMFEGQEGVTWPEWVAAAQTAERLGFDAIFTSDHYFSVMGDRDRGSSDAWTNLGWTGGRHLVDPTGHHGLPRHLPPPRRAGEMCRHRRPHQRWQGRARHGCRMVEGGAPLPRVRVPTHGRTVRHAGGTARGDPRAPHRGRRHVRGQPLPAGVGRRSPRRRSSEPHPPIIVGGAGGPRLAALVSRWADEFDTVGVGPAEAGHGSRGCANGSTPTDGPRTR